MSVHKKTNKNRKLYGYATTPEQRKSHSKSAKKNWESNRILNLAMYGYATAPEILERLRISNARRRAKNVETCGFARDPEQREKENKFKKIRRGENSLLYGKITTPKERQQAQERDKYKRDENRRIYGQAVPPEWCTELRNRRIEFRSYVVNLYGGRCSCCGESSPEVLTFDHINGNGKTSKNRSGAGLVKAALTAFNECGYPNNKYRLLCWNCNTSIGYFGYCPHKTQPIETLIVDRHARYRRRLKLEMITAYGDKCSLCGETHQEFLTLDHINGNGAQHRRSLGSIGNNPFALRALLRRLGWPKDEYRLLCSNCNSGGKIAK